MIETTNRQGVHAMNTEGLHTVHPETPAAAAAETRAVPCALVSSLDAVARSRLSTVGVDALLAEVAALLSSAQISLVVVCDAAGAAVGVITETILVRQLGFGDRGSSAPAPVK